MKKYYLSMLLSLAALPVASQWQWPVKGVKTGEGIVYRPQDRIDKELNFGDLFIAAPAATDFPAQLVRCGRAKAIGRETGTGYHYMTAVKFAHLSLPNSHIEFTLPLVKPSSMIQYLTDSLPCAASCPMWKYRLPTRSSTPLRVTPFLIKLLTSSPNNNETIPFPYLLSLE